MPDYKTWLFEFIKPDEIVGEMQGEFVSIPKLDEDSEYESLTATVMFNNERRKININKGNFRRLSEVYGTNTDTFHHKRFIIRLPITHEEKTSRTAYILLPIAQKPDNSERKRLLKEKGLTDQQIADLENIGAL